MKIIIIGAVAGGTTAATKIRRNSEEAVITMYEKDVDISYSGCGLPYYIGGKVELSDIIPRDASFFKEKHNIDVFTSHEVLAINRERKVVEVKNLMTGETFEDNYDKLIISTGASVFVPPIEGIDSENVFFLRTVRDGVAIKEYIETHQVKKAVIAGTGFIGLEILENFVELGIDTTVVELAPQITQNFDEDMAKLLENKIIEKGIDIRTSAGVDQIDGQSVHLTNGETIETDMIIMATGVRANSRLAKEAGLELGVAKAIKVDDSMKTSDDDIYACGDCIETFDSFTKQPVFRPLGSTANKTGRICGDAITGGALRYRGNLGTGIYKLFDMTVGATGMTEKQARELGYDIEIIHMTKPNRPTYYGGKDMTIKAIADRETKQLLGVQIVGYDGVDKRLDVFVTLITYKATTDDLFHLDLAYTPPYSTTKDPVHYVGMVLDGAIGTKRKIATDQDCQIMVNGVFLDARSLEDYETKGHIEDAFHIPHSEIRQQLDRLNKDDEIVVYCNSGTTGNAVMNILLNNGFKNVSNLSGGHKMYKELHPEKNEK